MIANLPSFDYEGPVWLAQTGDGNSSMPMYRFYGAVQGAHFYTMSAGESDCVLANLPALSYEGVVL